MSILYKNSLENLPYIYKKRLPQMFETACENLKLLNQSTIILSFDNPYQIENYRLLQIHYGWVNRYKPLSYYHAV